MNRWRVKFAVLASTQFKKLDRSNRFAVTRKIEWLAENFGLIIPNRLKPPLEKYYKLRVGDLRVIYEADYGQHLLVVRAVDHRGRVYKRF